MQDQFNCSRSHHCSTMVPARISRLLFVLLFSPCGGFIPTIGSRGSDRGQFLSPTRYAASSTSNSRCNSASGDYESVAAVSELEHAREVFNAFDASQSGCIGAKELANMLSALDIDATQDEAAALFSYLGGGAEDDGAVGVTLEDFLPWYSEAANAAKQSAEVFQGIIRSRRTVDHFDKTEVDQAVIKRGIECAIAAPNRRQTEPWRFIQLGSETVAKAAALKQDIEGDKPPIYQKWTDIPGWIVVTYKLTPSDQQAQREDFKSVCCAVQNFMLSCWSEGVGTKWTDGWFQRTPEFANLVGVNTDVERVAGIIWYGFAKGGLGKAQPKTRQKGYDEVLDILP